MATTSMMPPPYKGQNDQYPAIAIQNPYCERMVNFNNFGGTVKLRQGNDLFCSISLANITPKNIEGYSAATPKLFEMYYDGFANLVWADITSGTASTVHTVAVGIPTADIEIQTLFFNNYLMYFGEGTLAPANNGPVRFDGSTWGNLTYSWPSSFNPFGGDVYKNRAYIINRLTPKYGYSGIDAISGAITEVDLTSILSTLANLYIIRPISLTQNLSAATVQAFLFDSGECLVYSGSYPNSPDWTLDSRFKITPPLRFSSYVDAKGDSFILTTSEILSLRNLYISGYDKETTEGIGSAIQNRWQQIVTALSAATPPATIVTYLQVIKGLYDQVNDRLVIQLPAYVDPITSAVSASTPFQLIYDFKLKGWYEYKQQSSVITSTVSATYFNKSTYFLSGYSGVTRVAKLEGGSSFVDDDLDGSGTVAIDYQLRTAPLPISKFGANQISGLELIVKSGLYPQTNYKWIADLGRQETAAQPLEDLGSGVTKPMVNVGIQDAITVQLDISGSSVSNSVGLELYAMNVWYSAGGEASR